MSERAAARPPARPSCPPSTWERTYPGRAEQARRVRAASRAFLAAYPAADTAVLLANSPPTPSRTPPAASQAAPSPSAPKSTTAPASTPRSKTRAAAGTARSAPHDPPRPLPRAPPVRRVRHPARPARMDAWSTIGPSATGPAARPSSPSPPPSQPPGTPSPPSPNGPSGRLYSGARTDIINSHAELRSALDMLIKAPPNGGAGGADNAGPAEERVQARLAPATGYNMLHDTTARTASRCPEMRW